MRGEGPITRREQQVLELLAEYHTYEDISTILHVSIRTVHEHVLSLMIKTGIHRQALLIKYAIEQGYGRKVIPA
jgi:DNA-binding CsgD family transcriptional regulator